MNKLIRLVLLALVLLIPLPAVTGCKTLVPLIPKIVSVLADASATMQIIDSAVEEWFAAHPDVDPKVRAEYRRLYAKCQQGLRGANLTLQGADELSQDEYDAAFLNFKDAYLELRTLLMREGIAVGNKLGTGDATVDIPEPLALTYRVQ